ncbi:phosphomannomutase CpsG [Gilvimarinus agarilyticus]|uniref:phosphomannomutase CpsG n=1 Tax=Gilvimarinus sp. 2_MG-2023 TaxID=3062666 RepID=UPI001C08D289|nr:phosphomannomutase CpsG [Gilvimarinus sp. 2_MG-2023]MBU2887195.1 phosphomannomutase CpsG [Gilvimarinus agarilyticus]MDO6571854.1 phosphomannomutase CpsG [Gilvimarinus sp. 2_MG-2023]
MPSLTCFKAYDIRGKLGEELNEEIAYRIGRAYGQFLKPQTVVLGGDVRQTSEALKTAVGNGMRDEGVSIVDIGMTGTEEVYFATSFLKADGGIEVTASHNPIDYNGMKPVRENSKPISGDTGLLDIKRIAEQGEFETVAEADRGGYEKKDVLADYVQHLLSYVDVAELKPLKIVVNAGNGAAGHVIDAIEQYLPFEFIKIHHEPDASFPNGIPNPLLIENRHSTRDAVIEHGADLGIAWDGDFDRCFFFDEKGDFVEGYYVVGLLAEAFITKAPGSKVVHDPRLVWNTQAIAEQCGGEAVQSKTGHAFIKELMRKEDAIYGGEMSAHHYFRDFFYCDSGMIPWLLVTELMIRKSATLSSMMEECIAKYPSPGEINRTVDDAKASIAKVRAHFAGEAKAIDITDGIGMEFDDWRFNLRMSNTEPVVRLNVESRADKALMQQKTDEIIALLDS